MSTPESPSARRVHDPDGRLVVLDERTRGHLARRRPEMLDHLDAILGAVERPDHRFEDPIPGREQFFRQDLDPGRWLRVVVDFNLDPGLVVTAVVQRNDPDGWRQR